MTAVRILNEKKSTAGSPYVFYNVYVEEVENSRTADSVQLQMFTISHLQYSSSTLGSGSGYTLTGYLKINGVEYSIPIKKSNESWSGTTNHTSQTKTYTISNLLPATETLTEIKFRVVRGTGSTSSAGYLSSTSCSNISISIGHDVPSDVTMTIREVNPLLESANVDNNVFVENLSQKQLTFTYTLHDSATRTYVGVMNATNYYRSALNQDTFTIDLSQITLTKTNNQIPLLPFVEDNLDGFGVDEWKYYNVISYTNVSLTDSTTNAKRLGQTSGRVGLNINGVFYNGEVGNVNQGSTYKPTIKYKYWKEGDDEPSTYANTIPASNITITDNAFSVSNYDIGSTQDEPPVPNYFNPQFAYRIKVQVNDNFTTTESNELQIQVGEAIWTEYKDRVDFKALTIQGGPVKGKWTYGGKTTGSATANIPDNTTELYLQLRVSDSDNLVFPIYIPFLPTSTIRVNGGYAQTTAYTSRITAEITISTIGLVYANLNNSDVLSASTMEWWYR